MQVYISSIRGGTAEDFVAVHTTADAAWADLARWSRAYWNVEQDGPMPEDDYDVIERLHHLDDCDAGVEGPFEVNAPYIPRGPQRPAKPGEADPEEVAKLYAHWVANRRG
jgi:hypothetical protein